MHALARNIGRKQARITMNAVSSNLTIIYGPTFFYSFRRTRFFINPHQPGILLLKKDEHNAGIVTEGQF